jgi:pSer/pThr/pTyr-binding forkhead associated (FHA) protein
VSRRHAHLTYFPGTGDYRLQDDRSAHGTSILRGGRTIVVPVGSRGVRIESGDEIILGQARIRVTIL